MAGAGSLLHGATVTGAPFSAVEVTTRQQTLANGNVIQQQEQTNLFRDGQGRVREEMTWNAPNGTGSRTMVTISDPVAQVVRRLNPQSKTVSEMPMRQPPAGGASARMAGRQRPGAGSANVVKEDLGTQTMNGVAAAGTRITTGRWRSAASAAVWAGVCPSASDITSAQARADTHESIATARRLSRI